LPRKSKFWFYACKQFDKKLRTLLLQFLSQRLLLVLGQQATLSEPYDLLPS
jgi:hypothetical protein